MQTLVRPTSCAPHCFRAVPINMSVIHHHLMTPHITITQVLHCTSCVAVLSVMLALQCWASESPYSRPKKCGCFATVEVRHAVLCNNEKKMDTGVVKVWCLLRPRLHPLLATAPFPVTSCVEIICGHVGPLPTHFPAGGRGGGGGVPHITHGLFRRFRCKGRGAAAKAPMRARPYTVPRPPSPSGSFGVHVAIVYDYI